MSTWIDFGERVKNAAAAIKSPSQAAFLVNTIVARVVPLERDHNGGQPFPARPRIGGAA